MTSELRQYLLDAYENRHTVTFVRKITKNTAIQIDDQDDSDRIDEFCNIFCTIISNNKFKIDLLGNFPISNEMVDLIEIYNGYVDAVHGMVGLKLDTGKIEVLIDLADKIRRTSFMGDTVQNKNWLTISARTISSLYRFVRIIKEYKHSRRKKS